MTRLRRLATSFPVQGLVLLALLAYLVWACLTAVLGVGAKPERWVWSDG